MFIRVTEGKRERTRQRQWKWNSWESSRIDKRQSKKPKDSEAG